MAKKISCKKLRELVKEEESASREYKGYGFKKQSKDEKGHSQYFKKLLTGTVKEIPLSISASASFFSAFKASNMFSCAIMGVD